MLTKLSPIYLECLYRPAIRHYLSADQTLAVINTLTSLYKRNIFYLLFSLPVLITTSGLDNINNSCIFSLPPKSLID